MKTRILLQLTSASFYDTGHEIEDLSILKGCTVLQVTDTAAEQVVLTVQYHPLKNVEAVATVNQQAKGCRKAKLPKR